MADIFERVGGRPNGPAGEKNSVGELTPARPWLAWNSILEVSMGIYVIRWGLLITGGTTSSPGGPQPLPQVAGSIAGGRGGSSSSVAISPLLSHGVRAWRRRWGPWGRQSTRWGFGSGRRDRRWTVSDVASRATTTSRNSVRSSGSAIPFSPPRLPLGIPLGSIFWMRTFPPSFYRSKLSFSHFSLIRV